MGLKFTPAIRAFAGFGLALLAVMALKSVREPSEPAWVGSIRTEAEHVHPGMDADTLLSMTPSDGRFATAMHAWFPLYDRLEARGLVEVERRGGMYVVRRLAPT
jgi:hypothetical protein